MKDSEKLTILKQNEMLSIKDVCAELNLSSVYVRRMIQKGKIETSKVPLNKNQFKHMIARAEVERWRNSTSARTQRKDGRNKFTIYCTQQEAAVLKDLLAKNNLAVPFARANPPKSG